MFAKIWRRMTAPTFKVSLEENGAAGVVIAGERTKICTISIRLHRDRKLGVHQEKINFPRPRIGRVPGIELNFEDLQLSRETLELHMYVRVMLVGTYSITYEFPENDFNFKSIDRRPVTFCVKPSELQHLELSNITYLPGHGRNGSIFRGGTAQVWITGKDQFGNKTVESDLNLSIIPDNSFVALLSTARDSEQQNYVVTLRCEKVGVTSFDLWSQARQVVTVTDIIIIPTPLSATNSYIFQRDIYEIPRRTHEAGKAIIFKLALFDIFGCPISSKERNDDIKESIIFSCIQENNPTSSDTVDQCSIKNADDMELQLLKDEQNSFRVRPLDILDSYNTCELEFTPFLARQSCFLLFVAGKEVKNSLIKLTVKPGPLAKIKIVKHEPPASNQTQIVSYPTEERVLVVEGIDKFGNNVDLDPNEWCLMAANNVSLLQVNNVFVDNKAKRMYFQYTFKKKGRCHFIIKPKTSTNTDIKSASFVIEVARPPIDPKKCDVRICQEQPIFTGNFRALKLHVTFRDCTKEKYVFPDVDIGYLSVTVDNTIFTPTFKRGSKHHEAYLTLSEVQEGGIKKVQVKYKEKSLGSQITVDIVGLVTYKNDDYLDFIEDEKKILCIGLAKELFFGVNGANVKNINRILEKSYPGFKLSHDILTQECEGLVVFNLSSFTLEAYWRVFVLLSLLLRGARHFRNQATEFDDGRERWKEKATRAYYENKHQEARECKAIKEKYGELMNKSHRLASDSIFEFYNYGRPQSIIDLHGQIVGNPEKEKFFREQLLSKGQKTIEQIDAIVERERQERDEAIRKLEERLWAFDHDNAKLDGEDWLEIIVGAGHHSAIKGQQKIRPKVQEYLGNQNIKFVEANEGALLITFSEYTGKEPCAADFYCRTCKRTWTSASSWKGVFQTCYRCAYQGTNSECYPMKMRVAFNAKLSNPFHSV